MEEKKKKLRQKALSQRKLLPIGIKRAKSKKIVESIINSDEYKTNNVFFAYAALEDEVNIDEFIIHFQKELDYSSEYSSLPLFHMKYLNSIKCIIQRLVRTYRRLSPYYVVN